MRSRSRHGKTVLVAAVVAALTAALTTTGPAVAHGVRHAWFAHNADKVDGKHAVAASTSIANRRGKLVATNASGLLPNNIISKAADANALDGLDSTDFAAAGGYDAQPGLWSFSELAFNCDTMFNGLVGPSVAVNVGPSGLVAVWAEARIQDFGPSLARVQLFEDTSLSSCPTIIEGDASSNGGIDVKRTLPGSSSGTTGLGAPLIVQVASGLRTFTLRYGFTPNALWSANISQRKLWVQPL
jgi:hypothetical protein